MQNVEMVVDGKTLWEVVAGVIWWKVMTWKWEVVVMQQMAF
jgi:hypothetical protein